MSRSKTVLVDFHHSSLLRSFNLTFGRFGWSVYRPIGMEWYEQDFWNINDQVDTAKQYLSLDQGYQTKDGTPKLNKMGELENSTADVDYSDGYFQIPYVVDDPGGKTQHLAVTLEWLRNNKVDYIIASIPAHIKPFERLIKEYQPDAKLIVQMGNNWDLQAYEGYNVMASIAQQEAPGVNAHFYHQEFDTSVFEYTPAKPTKKIYSFVNLIEETGRGWEDYQSLKALLEPQGYEFKAFGGQCPDGNKDGAEDLALAMRECQFVFHVKPGGDGYGHILHNAFASGRPVITRESHYDGQLGKKLFQTGTTIDLDRYSHQDAASIITRMTKDPSELETVGRMANQSFVNNVDFDKEAEELKKWIEAIA